MQSLVFSQIDDSHPAGTDLLDDSVVADDGTEEVIHGELWRGL